ncbi:MAG TPA: hypothetical protein DHU96_19525 [Actinobacteria bacterium]|nr:hypothetical protein [Actinomycetota bacterium]
MLGQQVTSPLGGAAALGGSLYRPRRDRFHVRAAGCAFQPVAQCRVADGRHGGPAQVIMHPGSTSVFEGLCTAQVDGLSRSLQVPCKPEDRRLVKCHGLEVTRMSAEQQHLGSGPVLAGGAGDDLELDREEWAAVCPREITAEQWRRFEGYMLEIFTAMGMPAGTVSTADTPRRFLRAVFDATSGYEGDEKLVTAFPTECHGGPDCRISQVVEGPIPFFALCEHHTLPFFGKAYAGYIAHEPAAGTSPGPGWSPGGNCSPVGPDRPNCSPCAGTGPTCSCGTRCAAPGPQRNPAAADNSGPGTADSGRPWRRGPAARKLQAPGATMNQETKARRNIKGEAPWRASRSTAWAGSAARRSRSSRRLTVPRWSRSTT